MGCQHQPLTAVFIFTSLLGFTHASQICAYSKQPMVKFSHLDDQAEDYGNNASFPGEGSSEPRSIDYCVEGSDYCYALWQEDPSNKSDIVILAQGCWGNSAREDCVMNKCISNKEPSKAKNNTKFCCCYGNLCNVNVTDVYIPNSNHTEIVQSALLDVEQASYKTETVIIALATVFSVTMITVASYFILRIWSMTRKSSSDSINLIEAPPSPTFDLDSLKIQETVGRGRYGSVCRGTLHEHTVAVKIFNWQNRQYFLNEREIYSLPHMDHPCLAKLIGSEERIGSDGRQEYLLVLSYYPSGCLQDFLRHNTIDWSTLCKMALSTTRGLAHLHTEIKKGDKVKQCIAHRDLTSRNVLVKCDRTCVLCDFGFAMGISGSKYYQHEEEQVAETTSLAEVGTLMYMAPEIIEGAVNLRDCESSLKQIDVYALGLVLWEIATRCTDLFQGVEVPEYRLPFEAEVGPHPTMEQMQVLVTRHKARPLFPDIWKDTNPAVRALKETIEDCWDQDAEARLTTLCVEERLSELPLMWERYKAGINVPGVSPTINHTTNNHQKAAPSAALSSTSSLISDSITKDNSGDLSDTLCLSTKNEFPTRLERMNSVSENTTETVLSPSEPLPPYSSVAVNLKNSAANNTICSIPKVTVPLQPHQGRNPCMERNLMMDSTDEVSVSGNTLLDRHSHYKDDREHGLYPENHNDIFDILPGTGHNENSVLLSNDVLNHSVRASHPISYVQNVVHGGSNIPKQPNVPGNGYKIASASSSVNNKEDKKWRPFGIFDRKKGVWGEQGIKAGLKNFLERKCSGKGGKVLEEEEQPLRNSTPVVNKSDSVTENKCSASSYSQPYDIKKTDVAPLVDTEVHMVNSNHGNDVTVVCTVANGQIPCVQKTLLNASESYPEEYNIDNKNSQNHSVTDSIDQQLLSNSGDYSDSTKQVINPSILRTKRPTSLPVKGFQYNSVEESEVDPTEKLVIIECAGDKNRPRVMRNGSGKKKGVKRVKTPFEIKGRFSLYDDRIMSSQDSVSSQKNSQFHFNKTTTLSASLPVDIDSMHT